jgi:hypothetical protein
MSAVVRIFRGGYYGEESFPVDVVSEGGGATQIAL